MGMVSENGEPYAAEVIEVVDYDPSWPVRLRHCARSTAPRWPARA